MHHETGPRSTGLSVLPSPHDVSTVFARLVWSWHFPSCCRCFMPMSLDSLFVFIHWPVISTNRLKLNWRTFCNCLEAASSRLLYLLYVLNQLYLNSEKCQDLPWFLLPALSSGKSLLQYNGKFVKLTSFVSLYWSVRAVLSHVCPVSEKVVLFFLLVFKLFKARG